MPRKPRYAQSITQRLSEYFKKFTIMGNYATCTASAADADILHLQTGGTVKVEQLTKTAPNVICGYEGEAKEFMPLTGETHSH